MVVAYFGEEREMKKNDLVKEIAKRLDLPKVECEKVIDTMAEVITDALIDGDKVSIRGFLSFETSELKAREGYNPMSKKMETFEPTRTVKCKVGKPIKEAINEK